MTTEEIQQSAAVLGELVFQQEREKRIARAQALKLAELEQKIQAQKSLVMRMLNKEKRPLLHVVK